jgi:hypothetical protein
MGRVASFETVTTADGAVLEYLVSGPPDGRTLLFQPGTPNAGAAFRAIVAPAAELGLRTVSYSRPGYGQSTPRPGRSVADAAADIETVLDAAGAHDFVTLGCPAAARTRWPPARCCPSDAGRSRCWPEWRPTRRRASTGSPAWG